MTVKTIIGLGVVLLAASLGFFLIPQIDLVTAHWFLELGQRTGPQALDVMRSAGWFVVLGTLVTGLAFLFLRPTENISKAVQTRKALYILAVLAVGPGLTVNVILKDHWGRARPRDVIEFGGDMLFSPAWGISDQCVRNCSFVSGEGAFAFTTLAIALILPAGRRRNQAIIAAIVLGGVVSATRMAQGAHFLSDSVIGALIVALTAGLFHRLILGQMPREPVLPESEEHGTKGSHDRT